MGKFSNLILISTNQNIEIDSFIDNLLVDFPDISVTTTFPRVDGNVNYVELHEKVDKKGNKNDNSGNRGD